MSGTQGPAKSRRSRASLFSRALAALLFLDTLACAEESGLRDPLQLRNLSPLYHSLGLPMLQSATPQRTGTVDAAYRLSWASHALLERGGAGTFELDGETRRHEFSLRYGLTQRLSVDVLLPWIIHEGGHLDSVIDGWHAFWGLPDGPRKTQPQNQLRYAFDGEQPFFLEKDSRGPGDAEVGLSAQLLGNPHWQVGAFLRLKFDSGDAADFTGSGDTGVAAGLRWTAQRCLWDSLSCHAQIGYADVGNSALDPRAAEQTVFGGLSLAWAVTDRLALIGQLEGHEVLYTQPALRANGTPLWGSLGLRWQASRRWAFEASFAEDLQVGTAPDVTFQFGLRYE